MVKKNTSQSWIHFEGVEDKSQDDFIKYGMKLSVAICIIYICYYDYDTASKKSQL